MNPLIKSPQVPASPEDRNTLDSKGLGRATKNAAESVSPMFPQTATETAAGAAHNAAAEAQHGGDVRDATDPALAEWIAAWPGLSEAAKNALLAMVRATVSVRGDDATKAT